MTSPQYQVRRATLEDVGQLTALWQTMNFAAEDLSRRITEFQVAVGAESQVLGAIGLQMAERQGLLHSEAFTDFALAEQLRPLLLERLHSVAANHGLLRFWTLEQAPFWSRCGLTKADPEAMEKLPAAWRSPSSGWLTQKLKEDLTEVISADREFALFMKTEKERTARALSHARALKLLATLIALGILALVIAGTVVLFRQHPQLLHFSK